MTLSANDAWGIARAIHGYDLPEDEMSAAGAIAARFVKKHGLRAEDIRYVLADLMEPILQADPAGPLPEARPALRDVRIAPELPSDLKAGEPGESGAWVREYIEWASGRAFQTPKRFHLAAGLWLAALPIARRMHAAVRYGAGKIYPNDYFMFVAISTFYRKSTGMHLAADFARQHLPHLLITNPGSPETFLDMLSGRLPDLDGLAPHHQERLKLGQRFAACGGLVRDEISALFRSYGRDYMAGMSELMMELWDAPPYKDHRTKSGGLIVIERAALSILGATTPASLADVLTERDWESGTMARFMMVTPEENFQEAAEHFQEPPKQLVREWKDLYKALPLPPVPGEDPTGPLEWPVQMTPEAYTAFSNYEEWLKSETASLDQRLNANYGRLHERGVKYALIAAALRWVREGQEGKPLITLPDWWFAQEICEMVRYSAHDVLSQVGKSEDEILEDRIIGLLLRNLKGLTERQIYRTIGSKQRPVQERLRSLIEDGVIEVEDYQSANGGPKTVLYKLRGRYR